MLKVGLIGCGFMGSMHANCYKAMEDACVTAVADVRLEKAEELAKLSDAKIYSTGLELIEKADVDVIDICLPTYLHAEHALAAMDKVKYVFVEKPVTLTKNEARALVEKEKKTGAQVQVGQVVRFFDEYMALADIIKENRYGKVISANFRRLSPTPRWGFENWLLDSARSGGAGQDLHIHDVDYVLSVFGKPNKIFSIKNGTDAENLYVNTLMQYDGFPVSTEGTWGLPDSYPFTATFRVMFKNATLEAVGGKLLCYTNAGVTELKLEKRDMKANYKGGNISDLGAYFTELLYFCEHAAAGLDIDKATLTDAAESLEFVLDELSGASF